MSAPTIPAAPSAAPATTTAPASGTDVATGDFLLMLGQLLGAPVAASASKPTVVAAAADEGDLETATKDAAEITGVPVPAAVVPLVQSAKAEAGAQVDVVASLQTGGDGAGKATAALSKALPEALMQADSGAPEVAVAPPAPADISHHLRASASHDPGPQRPLHQPVGTSAWADELGTRMVLMSERGQQSASLRLNPENLGPLEVRISVRDDQASVWFGSAHSDTRAAIEQALPRLRELFASQGLSLTDAGVHHEAPREQSRQSASSASNPMGSGSEAEATSVEIAARLGLVDEYV